MLTTTTPGPLVFAAAVTTVVGVLVVVVAALAGGESAAYGALVGAAIALVILSSGAFAVDTVARLMPVASLLVALLTYTMQVLLMLVVFVGLNRSGALDETLDREWLGGAIIAVVLGWSFAHLTASAKARIPAFDTPDSRSANPSSEGARPAAEGGARR